MKNAGWGDMLEEAAKLNVQYYRNLFGVTREYVTSLRQLWDEGTVTPKKSAAAPTTVAPPVPRPQERPAAPAVPPLLLAAAANKVAEAKFAVTNSTGAEIAADPLVSDNLIAAGVAVEPEGLLLATGEEAVFTLHAKPKAKQKVGEDVHGNVSIPGLGDREIPIVVRRLPAAGRRSPRKPMRLPPKRG